MFAVKKSVLFQQDSITISLQVWKTQRGPAVAVAKAVWGRQGRLVAISDPSWQGPLRYYSFKLRFAVAGVASFAENSETFFIHCIHFVHPFQ